MRGDDFETAGGSARRPSAQREPPGTPPPPTALEFGSAFGAALDGVGERERIIARTRTYARPPERLAALGDRFGVSRERARQLEVRLRKRVEEGAGDALRAAARWLRASVGEACRTDAFRETLDALLRDVPTSRRLQAEVAIMAESGYEYLDGAVGDESFRVRVARVKLRAPDFTREAGVVREADLRWALGEASPHWEAMARNAGLIRIGDRLVLRDTRHARVFLALQAIGRPVRRREIAAAAGLTDNSSLSSMLSSDANFVRFTKDKWGLAKWTDEPYEGVVKAIVRRIEDGGGKARVGDLAREIPAKFEVLPATVRNYMGTRKFEVRDGWVRLARSPVAPKEALEKARDVAWTPEGLPVLRFRVGAHHLKGNSQKVSIAVAQHLGVGIDQSRRVPFASPPGVAAASVIWRSYDPNGPEMGRMREALSACGIEAGEDACVVLAPDGLRMRSRIAGLADRRR